MKILLIQPSSRQNNFIYRLNWRICTDPHFALQYLAALIPSNHEVKVLNENQQKINFKTDADVIGITCLTPNALRGYEIADEYRKRGKTVILGGYHPTALPKEAKQHADSVVVGDSEMLWPSILKDVETGELKPFYASNERIAPDMIPNLRRDLFRGIHFIAPVEATKGCFNRCKFCAITYTKKCYVRRPIDSVIEEIESIKHKVIHFHDPSLASDVKYAVELFKKMKGLNKKFLCQATIDILNKNEDLLKYAKDAGCISWNIGLETVSQQNITDISKTTNIVSNYKPVINKIKSYGMEAFAGIIFGFDNDYPDVFKNTLDFLNDCDINTVGFHVLTPFPITPLFKQFEEEGRILSKDWSKYDLEHVVFKPKNMTPEELEDGLRYINRQFYSFKNLKRRLFSGKNLGFYGQLHSLSTWVPAVIFNPFKR